MITSPQTTTTPNTQTPKVFAPWYRSIIERSKTLSEELGLDEQNTSKVRDQILEIAKEQFKVGNKNGIRWLQTKLREKVVQKEQVNSANATA